jgi:hypothetical protein
VMIYVPFSLSWRNAGDLLFECGIDVCHERVPHQWNRFGALFAASAEVDEEGAKAPLPNRGIPTDNLRSHRVAMSSVCCEEKQECLLGGLSARHQPKKSCVS